MNKTKIEWCDYTINPIKGLCKYSCWYCYAHSMHKRFKWDSKVKIKWGNLYSEMTKIKQPSKIFVGSIHDIFGKWISDDWIRSCIGFTKLFPQHNFQFLTKNPERYKKFEFPINCWLGTTITSPADDWRSAFCVISSHKGIKFISIEPLLGNLILADLPSVDWIIIGAMTGLSYKMKEYAPKLKWIKSILNQAKEFKIPVFMKNNLKQVWKGELRQEFPK